MTDYIVSEEELRRVAGYVVLDDWIDEYINTKQPITKVAEGEVQANAHSFDGEQWCYVEDVNGELINIVEEIEKYDGKNIKIYIEESK
jgi:hypothetical protein